ncbi:MAG: ABC transporter substrate-binding protein [Pseudomonadota bacterium]
MKKFLIACLVLFISTPALSEDTIQTIEVKSYVEDIGNKIIKIAAEKGSESKKRDKIISVINGAIDADWLARFVLSRNYKTSTDAQKERFTKLYRDFMINTYGPKFKNYNGKKFTVNDVTEQNGFYIAKAEFLPRDSNTPISVNFRVKERNGKLMILDFIAEGVSLIETQRSEFNSAISQKGMDQFLDDLEERVKQLKEANS